MTRFRHFAGALKIAALTFASQARPRPNRLIERVPRRGRHRRHRRLSALKATSSPTAASPVNRSRSSSMCSPSWASIDIE